MISCELLEGFEKIVFLRTIYFLWTFLWVSNSIFAIFPMFHKETKIACIQEGKHLVKFHKK